MSDGDHCAPWSRDRRAVESAHVSDGTRRAPFSRDRTFSADRDGDGFDVVLLESNNSTWASFAAGVQRIEQECFGRLAIAIGLTPTCIALGKAAPFASGVTVGGHRFGRAIAHRRLIGGTLSTSWIALDDLRRNGL